MIKILFFARIREQLGTSTVTLPLYTDATIGSIKRQLINQHGGVWAEVLSDTNLINAVNQEVVEDDCLLADGDEVAFFPPVTGG